MEILMKFSKLEIYTKFIEKLCNFFVQLVYGVEVILRNFWKNWKEIFV